MSTPTSTPTSTLTSPAPARDDVRAPGHDGTGLTRRQAGGPGGPR